jgi:hypothetical protein
MKKHIPYNDSICIKESLTLWPLERPLIASIIYNKYKNDIESQLNETDFSEYEFDVLGLNDYVFPTEFLTEYDKYNTFNSHGKYLLTDEGKRFIKQVKARKETRYLLNIGCDLFPETANLIEKGQKL